MVRLTWAAGFAALVLMGCDGDPCQKVSVSLVDEFDGANQMVATIANDPPTVCEEFSLTEDVNFNEYIIGYYFSDGAGLAGLDAKEAFEIGADNYKPAGPNFNIDDNHHFDIRRKIDLMNNHNAPSMFVVGDLGEGNYESSFNLTGVPAYLHLALENIEDMGGGKTWQVTVVTQPDGSPVNNDDWTCLLDNEYTFMKGGRVMYDPNKSDNSGLICDNELSYFEDPSQVTAVYGTYSLSKNGEDETILTISITTGMHEPYTDELKIVSSDFDHIIVEVENNEGNKGLVTLEPIAFPENL